MRPTTILLTCGIAAGVLVPALILTDGVTRPGYSLLRHGASQLGTGERGWLQTVNFVIGGLLLLAFAAGLLEHAALLVGFAWITAAGARLRRLEHPGRNVDDIIERLALTSYAARRARTLSMGNLQRLALAKALLHRPDLLILDEPVNGLDPAGVVEIRALLTGLAREHGTTVLISSHLLAEVARLNGRIAILHQGRLLAEHDTTSLDQHRHRHLHVSTRDDATAGRVLRDHGYHPEPGLLLADARALARPEEVAAILIEAGVPLTELRPVEEDLEAYFLRIVGAGHA
ncbi:DUF998 domain-containing protein [Streptosporangium subroseum]|uniref:DUF998 domain-containing protein n=1 Tax=Streptosporangium subroseum TaxID=106412 RepID=UPI00308B33AF|nr:DUF998 domain-containing protein [Streptosporangium subroseum]